MNKKEFWLVGILVTASFLMRIFRLDTPPTYMFDEVYHAFTAVEMNRGNKMAWEWWNTPPKGFAYEWTHPPLAKEFMVIGIEILGNVLPKQAPGVDGRVDPNPFAWRFPGALFGVGVVFLVFLLGKELFNARVGLISAFLVNFDGLNFVQSRIGMNDTFFLFFMLLAFYLFLRKKWWGVGVALGLSLAAKWTAIYAIGIIGVLGGLGILGKWGELGTKKVILNTLYLILYTLVIPVAVYLFSYLPFFTSGHTWSQFNELQHQMWWYHTNLRATHPYTSPWYSWPVLYRPVWYYVNYGKETLANIYALGNPAIWWPGILAVGYAIWSLVRAGGDEFFHSTLSGGKKLFAALTRRPSFVRGAAVMGGDVKNYHPPSRNLIGLLIVLLGYFGFFLPWAFSPRIMFLYHYLPSVPFMCLALGYGLDRLWHNNKLVIYWYLLVVLVVFVYFYPQLSGLAVPKSWAEQYFWFPNWK